VSSIIFLGQCYSLRKWISQVPGLRMVSGQKKKKGLVNVPKPTRPTPMERIAAQRKERRALQIHNEDPQSAPPSPAQDARVNQGDNVYRPESPVRDDVAADNDSMPAATWPQRQPRRRTILLDDEDEEDEEEREEEEKLVHRQPAEEQEQALVAAKTGCKVTLTVTAMDRSLLPARQQV
jgi:hypothetical protein